MGFMSEQIETWLVIFCHFGQKMSNDQLLFLALLGSRLYSIALL